MRAPTQKSTTAPHPTRQSDLRSCAGCIGRVEERGGRLARRIFYRNAEMAAARAHAIANTQREGHAQRGAGAHSHTAARPRSSSCAVFRNTSTCDVACGHCKLDRNGELSHTVTTTQPSNCVSPGAMRAGSARTITPITPSASSAARLLQALLRCEAHKCTRRCARRAKQQRRWRPSRISCMSPAVGSRNATPPAPGSCGHPHTEKPAPFSWHATITSPRNRPVSGRN